MTIRTTSSKQESVLFAPPDEYTLKMFVGALNTESFVLRAPFEGARITLRGDYRPVKKELRSLVQAWFDSGPNVAKLFKENPVLARITSIGRAYITPTRSGRAQLVYMDSPDTGLKPGDPLDIALGLFFFFLLNPYNEKLGGPCKLCGKYYVKKTKRQKVYCSKRCGLMQTSKNAVKKRREEEHQDKLATAKLFLEKWSKTTTRKGWKEWVSDRTQISIHWLTRAVKSGELNEPVKNSP